MGSLPLNLLAVEDSEDDLELILHELKRGGYDPKCRRVESREALLRALAEGRPDIVISDYNLPGFNGLEALAIVRAFDRELPFVLITGTVEEKTAALAMNTGAQDYLIKGNTTRLLPILARELGEAERRRKSSETLHSREQQLLQAQKMEAVGQLAGGLAHDFNNILGVILLHAEAILDHVGDRGMVLQAATEILKAQDRASSLVKRLLAFGRRQPSTPRTYDLNALLEETRKIFSVALGAKHELVYELAAGLPRVKIDPVQIEQVLMNLVVNARDALGASGRLVLKTESSGERVCLSVADNGSGMDRETQLRAFEPFFTTKEVGKGSGLGLSMTLGIMQQHRGEIVLQSEVGQGTVFHLYFPATDEVAESDLVNPNPEGATGANILLVEDEDALRGALESNLKGRGFKLSVVRSGVEALELGEEALKRLDLLITDVHMPQMDGRELARRVIELNPKVRLLFISGNSGNLEGSGLEESSSSFLAKPFTGEALRKRIEELLSG